MAVTLTQNLCCPDFSHTILSSGFSSILAKKHLLRKGSTRVLEIFLQAIDTHSENVDSRAQAVISVFLGCLVSLHTRIQRCLNVKQTYTTSVS